MNDLILLIDDDLTLLELLSNHLRSAGYRLLTESSGADGLRMAEKNSPDLVILDVMMPGMDGWETCERLRKITSAPVIMLTAKGEELDKLRGFRLGVGDYVTKPFSFAELAARIGAVLARTRRSSTHVQSLISNDLIIDFERRQVSVAGRPVELTPTEFRLLETLARRAHRAVSTETLLAEVWGPQYTGEIEYVKHYIWALRKKVEADPGDPKHLITERGYGYRFE